jgi:hypothetical protein
MTRITVTLSQNERAALWELAQRERRDPRNQAALLLRRELERRGLLPADPPLPPQPPERAES